MAAFHADLDRGPRRQHKRHARHRHRRNRSALLLSSLLCLNGGGNGSIGIGIGIRGPSQNQTIGVVEAFQHATRVSTRRERSNYGGTLLPRANCLLQQSTRHVSSKAEGDVTADTQSPMESASNGDRGAISTNIANLSQTIGGTGRAKLVWDCYRIGIDPALFYSSSTTSSSSPDAGARHMHDDGTAKRLLTALLESSTDNARNSSEQLQSDGRRKYIEQLLDNDARRRQRIHSELRNQFPTSRYGQTLGRDARMLLAATYQSSLSFDNTLPQMEGGIATLSHLSVASDGTTKLLIRLRDGMEVESVIIPWYANGYSTLCLSSQVGCRQACRFCATGRMGLLRSLTAEEILAQHFWATKICRLSKSLLSPLKEEGKDGGSDDPGLGSLQPLPDITNLVFMGMGEPADAEPSVNRALDILTDVELYHLSPSKVTVSTVAPSPEAFAAFADSPCVLAWSVHAANDELRRQLVPTTKHTMEELRQGLVKALKEKPAKLRDTVMLEVALIDGLNDGIEQADELADLAVRIVDDLPSAKVLVNLIPFNDIGHPTYRKPSDEGVRGFQERLWDRGVYVHVRSTRGDDESAACGQLATKKKKERLQDH